MGDLATLAKARRELEDLYSGIPDESVNLTFQDFAQLQQNHPSTSERKQSASNQISEAAAGSSAAASTPNGDLKISSSSSALTKLPSLDFNRAFEASNNHHQQQQNNHHHDKDHFRDSIMNVQDSSRNQYGQHHSHHHVDDQEELALHDYGFQGGKYPYDHQGNAHGHHPPPPPHAVSGYRADDQRLGFSSSSMGFDDVNSHIMSTGRNSMDPFQANAAAAGIGRRRPGIPHSNICTICSVYIYMFRHRCLVCGRVYCRQCVSIGMGEMTEGRKCIECLGKRFSQRYIQRAGKIGCWAGFCMGYPSTAILQELKWAEKGPRRSGENRYGGGRSGNISRSRNSMTTRTPTSAHIPSTPPSFVVSSPYSPYSPANYHLPL